MIATMATEARAEAMTSSRWKWCRRSTIIPTGGGAGAPRENEAVPLAPSPSAAARMCLATGEVPGDEGAALALANDEHEASSSKTKMDEHRNGNGGGASLMLLAPLHFG
uniref:Uncharacterized protein n=1 Tax=Arundo donax TaxID=35708 RepID=A0A0A9ETM5_ARUDO